MEPNVADLRYFKLWILLNQIILVWNIKVLQDRVLKILRFKYLILFQILNSFLQIWAIFWFMTALQWHKQYSLYLVCFLNRELEMSQVLVLKLYLTPCCGWNIPGLTAQVSVTRPWRLFRTNGDCTHTFDILLYIFQVQFDILLYLSNSIRYLTKSFKFNLCGF